MAIREIWTGFCLDDSLDDGVARQEVVDDDSWSTVYLNEATFRVLQDFDRGLPLVRLFEVLEQLPDGTYDIPRSVLDPEAAEDVRNALALAEAGGDGCTIPGCWQDVTSTDRGFPLCVRHDGLMDDWDDLVA